MAVTPIISTLLQPLLSSSSAPPKFRIPPKTILRIERVSVEIIVEPESKSKGTTVRTWLSDGERMIEGLIGRESHGLFIRSESLDSRDDTTKLIQDGDIVQIDAGELVFTRKRKRNQIGSDWIAWIAVREVFKVQMEEDLAVRLIDPSSTLEEELEAEADLDRESSRTTVTGLARDGDRYASGYNGRDIKPDTHTRSNESKAPILRSPERKQVRILSPSPPPIPKPTVASNQTQHEGAILITRKLHIYSLYDLKHPRTRLPKNCSCDVLAVICSVSPHVAKTMGRYVKRDLRIMDSSLDRFRESPDKNGTIARMPKAAMNGIQLSVFVDAERFRPEVGTVALIRNLKTHTWEGVSLNAYEAECKNRAWFLERQEVELELREFFDKEEKWWREIGNERWIVEHEDNDSKGARGECKDLL